MKIKDITIKNIKDISDYTANHFGFQQIESSPVSYNGLEKNLVKTERQRIAYYYKKNDLEKRKNPVKFYYYNTPILNTKNFKNKNNFGLDIYNIDTPVAEALLIITINNILKENNYKNFIFEINILGDKESTKNFKKELTKFYKQEENFNKLTHIEKSKLPKDVISLLFSKKDFMIEINKNAPVPISTLSESSSTYLSTIIEYLDSLNIPYRFNNHLLDDDQIFSDFIFRVVEDKSEEYSDILALGGRYDDLAKIETEKKKTTSVGASLFFNKKTEKITLEEETVKFNLLKISDGSEKHFLKIIETFLELKQPITFYSTETKITEQLELSKESNFDYSIIFGQKEFLEKSVLVRKIEDKSQKIILQKDLKEYLKKEFKL